ncbi:IS3 family transposase, partial [Paenibacillus sp. PsM32]
MAKKGQTFHRYSEETKREAVRLRSEEGWSYPKIMERLGISSKTQIGQWVKKSQTKEGFTDQRGRWNKTQFESVEEENAYLKAQVEYFKKAQSKSTWGGQLDFHARCESVQEMSRRYPLSTLCKLAEISRAGYYKWKKGHLMREQRQNRDADLKAHLLNIHRLRPYFGVPRMQMALRREGVVVNHKKVRRLMRELSIRSVIRQKRPFAGRKPSVCFANVLNRAFASEAPGQKLVTDVTYVRTGNTFVYLSVVLDLYNNEVKAWVVSERNDLKLVTDTIEQLDNEKGLVHSDQGFQYTTKSYAHLLQTKGLTGSHSRRG